VVEDIEDDILLLRLAFRTACVLNPVMAVRSGAEAIAYLVGDGEYQHRNEFPLPKLILLDLKMPGMDGFELLAWIRNRKEFAAIAIVVLTSSDAIQDVKRAYDLGANSFLVKETEFKRTVELSRLLRDYWLQLNWSPGGHRAMGLEQATRGREGL
jgi:CheY-like chemotaxis protein